jgi:hypothetical protein
MKSLHNGVFLTNGDAYTGGCSESFVFDFDKQINETEFFPLFFLSKFSKANSGATTISS